MGYWDRMEKNYLSNILPKITTLHADASNSPFFACAINLIKMCVYGSSGNAR